MRRPDSENPVSAPKTEKGQSWWAKRGSILQAPAGDERGMVRHYTLTSEDLVLISRRRADPNRLGFTIMLCYLRFPVRILQQGEQSPRALRIRLCKRAIV